MLKRVNGTVALLIAAPIVFVLIMFGITHSGPAQQEAPLSSVLRLAAGHAISSASIDADGTVHVALRNGRLLVTHKEPGQVVTPALMAGGAQVSVNGEAPLGLGTILGGALTVLLVGVVLYSVRSSGAGAGTRMRVAAVSGAAEQSAAVSVTFNDVAGVDEAKGELAEVVEFLAAPERFRRIGARIPRGVLLSGPPGTGKTLLARAVAGEAGVPFYSISGSDFVEMFVGVGASRVRDLFDTAKANRPSLIFIDEIDAVGRQRGAGLGGGHDEREQTLNQLLVEMDGFDPNAGVIMIAATNRPDVLDPALLRPGRFDRQVTVDPPDVRGREAILNVHLRGKPLAEEVSAPALARRTPGFSGADLANLVNEAALLAARYDKTKIGMDDFNESVDRVVAGPQRKSRIMNDQTRERIAYHEVGHAIVGELLPNANPVHKVSILPRGRALGYTMQYPTEDKYLTTRQEFLDDVSALLAGRVAEETVFNEVTTGASNDFERATAIARAMVCEYGMSERLGPVVLGTRHGSPFLGRDWNEERNYSETIAVEIDKEVRAIIDECYERSRQILTENRVKMDEIVRVLLEKEMLEREDFMALMEGAKAPALAAPPVAPQAPPTEGNAPASPAPEKPRRLPNLRPEPA